MPAPVLPSARTLNTFRRLEFIAQKVVEGLVAGVHKSRATGFSLDFDEHRIYAPGDDLKHLDWKILAKKNRLYVKRYEEETSLRAYLVVDRSGSMGYGPEGATKLDAARQAAAILACVLMRQKDAVGLVTCDSGIRAFLPPRSTKAHLRALMATLGDMSAGEATGLGAVLHALALRIRRRGLIVILSDLFDDPDDIVLALTHFAHRKHEMAVFQVLDRREAEFPFQSAARFESLEGAEARALDPQRLRAEYLRQFAAHQGRLRAACHDLHIDFVPVFTDEPVAGTLARYLANRVRR